MYRMRGSCAERLGAPASRLPSGFNEFDDGPVGIIVDDFE